MAHDAADAAGADAPSILVVDDDPDTRTFLTTVLEDAGYRTVEAHDGEDALAKVAEQRFALISLDVAMPERSGVSVYRALREDAATREVPVVVITGVAPEFKRFISTRKRLPPPDGYLPKPVDHVEYLALIERVLARRSATVG